MMFNLLPAPGVRNQYIATVCANIITVAHGASCGWPSSALLSLQSDKTLILDGPITRDEGSSIVALMFIGALIGNLFFSWLGNIIGRKKCICVLFVPQFLSWMVIVFATEVYHLYISRILAGLTTGGILLNHPQFVAEISDDSVRGTLSSIMVFTCDIGFLVAYVVGYYCPYPIVPLIHCWLPVLFIIGFFCIPDTPVHLVRYNRIDAAEESIRFYSNIKRDTKHDLTPYIEAIKKNLSGNGDDNFTVTWRDFLNRQTRKSVGIGFVLILYNQLCGTFAMLNYAATIFATSGSNLTPQMSAIVVGIIQLIGAYMSLYLVDVAGRKILLGFSGLGACLGHVTMAVYTYLQAHGYNVESFTWIPVTSISFVIFIASCGVTSLPFTVIAEIVPPKIRNICVSMCMYLLLTVSVLSLKFFPSIVAAIGMHGAMTVFATCTFIGSMFVLFCIPETKGKSFEEISKML